MRSTADPDDTKRVIQSFLSRLAGTKLPPAPVFSTLDLQTVLEILTEPDGLIPHAYKLTKTVRGTVSADGKEQHAEQIDTTEVRFAYP